MRLWIVLMCALGAAMLIGGAQSEDGGPIAPLSSCDVTINLGANEDYYGTAAWECVNGGSGSNSIKGNGGRDRLTGSGGTDPLYGDAGQDVIYGGLEGDHMEGGSEDDYIYAGCAGGCDQTGQATYFNDLHGGDGNDVLAARNNRGDDVLYGGNGLDTCYVDRSDETHSCEDKRVG